MGVKIQIDYDDDGVAINSLWSLVNEYRNAKNLCKEDDREVIEKYFKIFRERLDLHLNGAFQQGRDFAKKHPDLKNV